MLWETHNRTGTISDPKKERKGSALGIYFSYKSNQPLTKNLLNLIKPHKHVKFLEFTLYGQAYKISKTLNFIKSHKKSHKLCCSDSPKISCSDPPKVVYFLRIRHGCIIILESPCNIGHKETLNKQLISTLLPPRLQHFTTKNTISHINTRN